MKDETYAFISDVRGKGQTARSAKHKRSHTGKGGRVKLPSDNMTAKELKAMNGEVKAYRLNEPMTWQEFKAMPDDIKVTYIKLLREKFGVPDCKVADMMGVHKCVMSGEIKRIGLGHGEKHGGYRSWDQEGFLAWRTGAAEKRKEGTEDGKASLEEICELVPCEPVIQVLPVCEEKKRAIPDTGNVTFEGMAEDVLNTLGVLLGGARVHISITWDVLEA